MSAQDDFVRYIRNRDYPSDLKDAQLHQAWSDAATDIQLWTPIQKYGYFEVVSDQEIYDIFNRSQTSPPETVDSMGYRVVELIWSIQPDHSTDPFLQGPFLGPYNGLPMVPFASTTMWRPSDAIIYQADLEAVHNNFFDASYETIDNDPKSPVRLTPMPRANGSRAWVKYLAYRDEDTLVDISPIAYKKYAEACVCKLLARRGIATAGKKFAVFEDRGTAVKLWIEQATACIADGNRHLEKAGIIPICPVSRS